MSGHARYHDPGGEQRTAYDQNYYSGNARNKCEQRYSGSYYGASAHHEAKYEQQSAIDRSYDQSYLGQQRLVKEERRNRYPPTEEPAQKYHAEDQRRVHQQPAYDNHPPPTHFNSNESPTCYQGDMSDGRNVSNEVTNVPSLQPKVVAETTRKGGGAAVFKVVGKANSNRQVTEPPPSTTHDYQYSSQNHGKSLSPIREQPPIFQPPASAPQRSYDRGDPHSYGGYTKDPYISDPYAQPGPPPPPSRDGIYSNETEERSRDYHQRCDELESSGYGSTTYTTSSDHQRTSYNEQQINKSHHHQQEYNQDGKYQPPPHSYNDQQRGGYQQPSVKWTKQPSDHDRRIPSVNNANYHRDGVDQSRIKGVQDVKRIFEKPQEIAPFPQGPSTRVGSGMYVMNQPQQTRRSSSDDYPSPQQHRPPQDTYQSYHHQPSPPQHQHRRDYYPQRDPSPPPPAVDQHPRYYDNDPPPPQAPRHQYGGRSPQQQYYEPPRPKSPPTRPQQEYAPPPPQPPQQEQRLPPDDNRPIPARYNDPPPSRGYDHGYQQMRDGDHRRYEDDRPRLPLQHPTHLPSQHPDERRPHLPSQQPDERRPHLPLQHPDERRPHLPPQQSDERRPHLPPQQSDERRPHLPPQQSDERRPHLPPQQSDERRPHLPRQQSDERRPHLPSQQSDERRPRDLPPPHHRLDDRRHYHHPPAPVQQQQAPITTTVEPPSNKPMVVGVRFAKEETPLPQPPVSPQHHHRDMRPQQHAGQQQQHYNEYQQPSRNDDDDGYHRPLPSVHLPSYSPHDYQPPDHYQSSPQQVNRSPQYQQPSDPSPSTYVSKNQPPPKSYQEPVSYGQPVRSQPLPHSYQEPTSYGAPVSKNQPPPKSYQEPASYGAPVSKNQPPKSYQQPASYGAPVSKNQPPPKSYQEPASYGAPVSKNQPPKSYQQPPTPASYGPAVNKNPPKNYQQPTGSYEQQQESGRREMQATHHHHQQQASKQEDLMTNEEVEQRFAHLGRSQQQLNHRLRATHEEQETDNESNYVPSIVSRSYNQFSQQQLREDFKSSDLPITTRPPRHPFDPIDDDDSSEGIDVDAVPTPPFNKYFPRTQHPLEGYPSHDHIREDLSSRLNATRLDNEGIQQPGINNSEIYRQPAVVENSQLPHFNNVDSEAPHKSLNHNHSRDRLRVARSGPPRKPPTRGSSSDDLTRDLQEYEVSVYPNDRRKHRESPLVVVEAPSNPKSLQPNHHQTSVAPTRSTNASRKSTKQQNSKPTTTDQPSSKSKSSFQPVGGKDKANTKIYFKKVDPATVASKPTTKKEEKSAEPVEIIQEEISADPKKRPVAYTDLLDQFKSARDSAYRNVLKKQQDMAMKPFKMIGNAAKRSLSPRKSAQEKVVSKNTAKIANSAPGEESNVYERNKPKPTTGNRNSARDRGRSRSRERVTSPQRPRGMSKERIMSPERPRGRSRERIVSPERPRGRSKERIISPQRPRGRSKERIMSPERSRGRSRERIDDYPRHINRDEMVRQSDRYGREVNAYRPPSDNVRFNEPEWVEQVRRKRNADKVPSSVTSSTIHERGWVKDPRWAPNRTKEVDFEDYEREPRRAPNDFRPSQPPKQLLPSKLMVKAPSSGKSAWKRDLGQRNKVAVRKR